MIHRGYNRAPRRQLIPNLFSNILKVIAEADRPLTHHEIVEAVSERMERSDEELSRQITVSLQDALIYGYLRVKNFRYSIVPNRLDPNEPRDLAQFHKSPVSPPRTEMASPQINQRERSEQGTSKGVTKEKLGERHQHSYAQSSTVSSVAQDQAEASESAQGCSNSQARDSVQSGSTQAGFEAEEERSASVALPRESIQPSNNQPGTETEEETNVAKTDLRPRELQR